MKRLRGKVNSDVFAMPPCKSVALKKFNNAVDNTSETGNDLV